MNKRTSKSNGDAPEFCLLCTVTAQRHSYWLPVHRPEVSTQIQAKRRAVQTSASLRHLAFLFNKISLKSVYISLWSASSFLRSCKAREGALIGRAKSRTQMSVRSLLPYL